MTMPSFLYLLAPWTCKAATPRDTIPGGIRQSKIIPYLRIVGLLIWAVRSLNVVKFSMLLYFVLVWVKL
jgi:hypothetical protein